jgi:membrane-associated HD superfamily phosphohydrolase
MSDVDTVKTQLYDNYKKDAETNDRKIQEALKEERFVIMRQLNGYTLEERKEIMKEAYERAYSSYLY